MGVSASANPTSIPAPGSGTSVLTANVLTDTETVNYPLTVTATDGTNSATAKVMFSVISGTTNPSATFKGCWYKNGGHQYQGVDISVKKSGTYPFNAVLLFRNYLRRQRLRRPIWVWRSFDVGKF